ncbi:hypothetical protein IFM89_026999 [Coptis chinensis]|uniref:Uncharacterized protein n=1 Tax=Coptis chinensis TaxID=261450 RepID=A0A835I5L7_9MAGN|nr:hypothetical protein IFM89_026999 [Coptis chinensis]
MLPLPNEEAEDQRVWLPTPNVKTTGLVAIWKNHNKVLFDGGKHRKTPRMLECYWLPPPHGIIKATTDGSSRGNLGPAAWQGLYNNGGREFGLCRTPLYIAVQAFNMDQVHWKGKEPFGVVISSAPPPSSWIHGSIVGIIRKGKPISEGRNSCKLRFQMELNCTEPEKEPKRASNVEEKSDYSAEWPGERTREGNDLYKEMKESGVN